MMSEIAQEFAMSKFASQQDRDAAILKALEAERAKRAADNAQYAADEIEWNGLIAAEREKVNDARRTAEYWKSEHLAGNEQLTAAQATIGQMREALKEAIPALPKQHPAQTLAEKLVALPTNLDQLHEDRALEIDKVIARLFELGALGDGTYVEELRSMSEAHRARKEVK